MKYLKRFFKKNTDGQTKIFSGGSWLRLENGKYIKGARVLI